MSLIKAVDFSRWQGDVSYETMKSLVDNHGIKMFILQGFGAGPGFAPNPNLEKHLGFALSLGCYVAIYSLPSWNVAEAIAAAGQYKDDLEFVAIDVEGGFGLRQQDIDYIKDQGLIPWIYSSSSQWALYGWSTHVDIPLWDARYYNFQWDVDNPPPEMQPQFYWFPYGGWTQRAGWQYNGDVQIDGLQVDVSLIDEDFLMNEQKIREIARQEANAAAQQVAVNLRTEMENRISDYNTSHYQDTHQFLAWAQNVGRQPKLLERVDAFLNKLVRNFVPLYKYVGTDNPPPQSTSSDNND